MKMKRTFLLGIIALLMVSCDRWSEGEFRWQNKSSHSVVMTFKGYEGEYVINLKPNQDTTLADITGPMRTQTIEEHFEGCRCNWFSESFIIEYDDGKVLKYTYPEDTAVDFSIYNINSHNLSYELSDIESKYSCRGWISKFEYALNDEQYESAE